MTANPHLADRGATAGDGVVGEPGRPNSAEPTGQRRPGADRPTSQDHPGTDRPTTHRHPHADASPARARPDAWDIERGGLITDPAALALLDPIHTVDDGPAAPDGATTYLTGEPAYVPYSTATMPCPDSGLSMARRIMRAVYEPELLHAVETGPLADIARRTTAAQATALWRVDATPAARGLARLGRVAPDKGGETRELWAEYLRRVPAATDPIMGMRDLWGSVYAWQFMRGDDARLHDLCASMMSLTSAVDFCDAFDDSGAGGHDRYMAAAAEGLAHLSGPAATLAARETVAVGALMVVKDAMATEPHTDAPAPVTPDEYMGARSWDGAIAPYYRLMLSTTHYRQVADARGEFTSAATCDRIQRAIDNIMRYNDVTDAVADHTHHESFNQLLLALAVRGASAVTGYGQALAEVTDAVLDCPCDRPGHDEAAELSMGACLWYLLTPRYQVRRQLAAFSGAGGDMAVAYAPAPAAARTLRPGHDLYGPDWDPLWGPALPPEHRPRRIARRSLADDTDPSPCESAAARAFARYDQTADDNALLGLDDDWRRVFEAALEGTAAGRTAYATALGDLVGRFWRQAVLGHGSAPGVDARLLMDVDEAVRATFRLPASDGLRLRRAFFGVASGAAELTGHNPFARLTDGLGTICAGEN
ncbi:hypothetical protein ACIRU8_00790 [Streptomyces sp. NPDC101175]|uniref:hypothetical protein n=1 Tax=Streptomyces sp. NPDC101175 TaxID=3366123 RepID=UPI00383477E8